jgi:hypothetical protein
MNRSYTSPAPQATPWRVAGQLCFYFLLTGATKTVKIHKADENTPKTTRLT